METGSVYRAKYRMQWAGIILFVLPMITDLVLKHEKVNNPDYWFYFVIVGIFGTFAIYTYVVGKIWKKIKARHIEIIIHKITNYHFICVKAIVDSDWEKVRIVLDKSLYKYDPASPITYFIKGSYSVGTNDIKSLSILADEIENIKNECINRV